MKQKRQSDLIELIQTTDIETQEDLIAALTAKGHNAAQSTVSRDLRELGVMKIRKKGKQIYALPSSDVLDIGVIAVETAQNLLVVKTKPALASAVCAELDTWNLPGVVGTLAGEDTVFVAMKTNQFAQKLQEDLKKRMLSC